VIDLNSILGGKLSLAAQQNVATVLFTWVAERSRKAPVQDLAQRLVVMRKDIENMAKSLELEIVNGKAVVKALGQGDATLRQLRNGTKWFDPMPDVNGMIVVATLSS